MNKAEVKEHNIRGMHHDLSGYMIHRVGPLARVEDAEFRFEACLQPGISMSKAREVFDQKPDAERWAFGDNIDQSRLLRTGQLHLIPGTGVWYQIGEYIGEKFVAYE